MEIEIGLPECPECGFDALSLVNLNIDQEHVLVWCSCDIKCSNCGAVFEKDGDISIEWRSLQLVSVPESPPAARIYNCEHRYLGKLL